MNLSLNNAAITQKLKHLPEILQAGLLALKDPTSNPRAALLILVGFALIVLLLVALVSLVVIIIRDIRTPRQRVARTPMDPVKRRRLVTVLLAVFALLLVVGVPLGWHQGTQNSTCARCHYTEKAFKSNARDTHAGVACASCHIAPGARGLVEAASRGIANTRVQLKLAASSASPQAVVRDSACLKCHGEVMSRVVKARGVRMRHWDVVGQGFVCTDCHNTAGHGTKVKNPRYPEMSQCITCHDGKKAGSQCGKCHSNDIGVATRETHDTYFKTPVPVDGCRGCHSMKPCIQCHGLELPHSDQFKAGFHALKAFQQPELCHKCHSTRTFCNRCHHFGLTSNDMPTSPHGDSVSFKTWHSHPAGPGVGTCYCHDANRQKFCDYCHTAQPSR